MFQCHTSDAVVHSECSSVVSGGLPCQRSCCHLVGEAGGLTDDPERQRLFVAQSLQVAADSRPLDLPLPQVVRKPDSHSTGSSVLLRCMYVRAVFTSMLYKSISTCAERPPGVF